MEKGDKVTMYFTCFGVTSEEKVTIQEVTEKEITITDYYNTDDGEENYRFCTKTGKCLNEPKSGFGGKRKLKID